MDDYNEGTVNQVLPPQAPVDATTQLPDYKDQIREGCGTASAMMTTNKATIVSDGGKAGATTSILQQAGQLPDYKDQVREGHGASTTTTTRIASIVNEDGKVGATINILQRTQPHFKDQAKSQIGQAAFLPEFSNISEENSLDVDCESSTILIAPDNTNPQQQMVTAHLVPDESIMRTSYAKAEIIDTRKEKLRVASIVICVAVAIVIIIMVPTYLLAIRDQKDAKIAASLPTTSLSLSKSPTLSPTVSFQPSTSPTMFERFYEIGEPILTDVGIDDTDGIGVSLSWNGNVIAVGNNRTIQVYEKKTTSSPLLSTWIPLGSPLIVNESERLVGFSSRNYYNFQLAANSLLIAVGVPSYQENSGKVDVYEYNYSMKSWVERGPSRVGNVSDQLGYQVALSSDGNFIGIAASNYDVGTSYAEVLEWNTTTENWQLLGRINGLSEAPDLSISLFESTIILGDPNDGIVGRAEVYECNREEGCFQLGERLQGPDYEDLFGFDVSIIGNRIAVASPGLIECRLLCANVKVYDFGRGTEAVWTTVGQELFGPLGFGRKVKLSAGRPNTLAILNVTEQYYEDLVIETRTHIYRFDGSLWTEVGTLPLGLALLDMSYDGNVIATRYNNSVVVHAIADNLII